MLIVTLALDVSLIHRTNYTEQFIFYKKVYFYKQCESRDKYTSIGYFKSFKK